MNATFKPRKVLGQNIKVMDAKEIQRFLSTFTIHETSAARELWRLYAGRKDLIDFSASKYQFKNMQYYMQFRHLTPHIRIIPYVSIKNDILRFSRGIRGLLREKTQHMIIGKMSGQDWYDETISTVKIAHRAAFTIEEHKAGDLESRLKMDRWLSVIFITYLAISQKASELSSGKVDLNNRLLLSADSYADSINIHFETWRLNYAMNEGYKEARRVVTSAETCHAIGDRPGCLELAQLGYQPIWKVKLIGTAACWHKCHCYLEYR